MKYVKTFEQLDYSTPFGKAQAIKDVKRTNVNNANFKKNKQFVCLLLNLTIFWGSLHNFVVSFYKLACFTHEH